MVIHVEKMKKIIVVLALINAIAVSESFACTNFIIGKDASTDGSVMVSYNADSYGMYGNMYRHVGGIHQKDEMRSIYEWDTNKYLGDIPQAKITYNVVGQINQNQVTITETTFGGREELADPEGIIDYGSLIYIALERATTAREAIDVMTSLVEKYGYCSEGETFSIADKNEAWIMEMVGKGKGNKGAVWVAIRIPDDCICAHANQSRITRFNLKDKKNVLYAKDVIKFAREKGYFNGKDEEFSFRDAYNPLDFSGIRYCDARVWSFYNRMVDGMDKFLPYVMGDDYSLEMPLYCQPPQKVSLRDVMTAMRDHYEGTPLEITDGLGAGAFNMPYRPSPLSKKVDGVEYFNERPISTVQTGFSIVTQMRNFLPDPVGGVAWFTNDDPNMAAYTPVYCGVKQIPLCYTRIENVQDEITFSWESAFWLCNTVANIVYPFYSKMFPDLEEARNELEFDFYDKQQEIETTAAALIETNPQQAIDYLTNYSLNSAEKMMRKWNDLFKFLVVKHNDMVLKPVENGKFKRSEHGLGASVVRPGYSEEYWRKIIKENPDKYKMK